MAMPPSTPASDVGSYFNLHTTGIGYLNRVREVSVRRGKPFLACTVAALHGATEAVEYTYIDCKVAGSEADRVIRQYLDAIKTEQKVLVSFRIGDVWVDPFLYEKGVRQGQPGASLKGRLLFIEWLKINGQLQYKAPAKSESQDGLDTAEQAGNEIDTDVITHEPDAASLNPDRLAEHLLQRSTEDPA